MSTYTSFITHLVFNSGEVVPVNQATHKQIVSWINEADTLESRTIRKQQMFYKLYGGGERKLQDFLSRPT